MGRETTMYRGEKTLKDLLLCFSGQPTLETASNAARITQIRVIRFLFDVAVCTRRCFLCSEK